MSLLSSKKRTIFGEMANDVRRRETRGSKADFVRAQKTTKMLLISSRMKMNHVLNLKSELKFKELEQILQQISAKSSGRKNVLEQLRQLTIFWFFQTREKVFKKVPTIKIAPFQIKNYWISKPSCFFRMTRWFDNFLKNFHGVKFRWSCSSVGAQAWHLLGNSKFLCTDGQGKDF